MSEINTFLSPKAEKQIEQYQKSITDISKKYKVMADSALKLERALNKEEKTTTKLNTRQKEAQKLRNQLRSTMAKQEQAGSKLNRQLIRQKEAHRATTKAIREQERASLGLKKNNGLIKSIVAAGAAFVGFNMILGKVVTTIKEAIQINRTFEKSISNVLTLLSDAQKIKYGDFIKQGAIDIVAEYGLQIEDVNKALFDAISAGVDAGDSIEFLRKNAQLAIGGVTNLTTAVDGVTSVMNAYGLESKDTDEVTSAFFTAQKFGKTTVEELSNSIGKTAPIAKQAGVGYKELLSVFAELTKQGISTDETATAIKATLTALLKPAEVAKKVFNQLGIETGATAIRNNGLAETLAQVSAAAEGNADSLSQLIPNVRALTGIGALGSEQLAEMDSILQEINTDFGEGSSLLSAFNLQMGTGEKEASVMKGEYQKLLVTLGGGESIFKKIGSAIRKDLTRTLQDTTKNVSVLANGSWVDRLKLAFNAFLNAFLKTFSPVIKIIEKITGKKLGLEINIKKAEDLIKKTPAVVEKAESEITKIMSEAEKKRIEIKRKAAELKNKDEKKENKKEKGLSDERIAQIKAEAQENLEIDKEVQESLEDTNDQLEQANDDYAQNERDLTTLLKTENEKRIDDEKEFAEIKKQLNQGVFNQAVDLANALFQLGTAQRNAEMNSISQNYDARIAAAEGNDAVQEKLEREKAERLYKIELEQAKAEKNAAVFNTLISAAQGSAQIAIQAAVLSSNPLTAALAPLAYAQLGLIAATTGVQLAAINAQPLPSPPQFADGTGYSPSTFIAGEAGRELMIGKDGRAFLTPDHASLYTGMEGTKILPNAETEAILNATNEHNAGYINTEQLGNKLDAINGNLSRLEPTIINDFGRYHEVKQGHNKMISRRNKYRN